MWDGQPREELDLLVRCLPKGQRVSCEAQLTAQLQREEALDLIGAVLRRRWLAD